MKSKVLFFVRLVVFIAVFVSVISCRTTKYVREGDFLLNAIEIENSTNDLSKQEIKGYIRQKENLKILGFLRFHLGLYNLSGRDTTKWINRWLRKIGEEPVIYDGHLAQLSTDQLTRLLHNKGYFRSYAKDSIIKQSSKKIKVKYVIHSSDRYKINHVRYHIEDDSIREIVLADTAKTLLKQGRSFDSNLHEKERVRITNRLKNLGYYAFSKEYIYYVVDSTIGNQRVNDSLIIKRALLLDSLGDKLEEVSHKRYKYRNVTYIFNEDGKNYMDSKKMYDTLEYANCKFLYKEKIEVHPSVIYSSSYIVPDDLYVNDNVERTQMLLSGLQIFRYVDIRFSEVNDSSGGDYGLLDVYIQLVPTRKQVFTVEIEGTNSSGNLGAASNIKYQHRNLFRGAEVFDLSWRGAAEREFVRGTKDEFNTYEFGSEASLEFPKFFMPFTVEGFRKRFNPKTSLALAYNYQRRPDYTRTIASLRFGYNWNPSKYLTHYLFVSDFNYVSLPYIHNEFWSYIDSTFLRYSYEDHFILTSLYSLVFNNQLKPNQKDYFYGRFNLEVAGNVLNALAPMWQERDSLGYDIFGVRFAQYFKSDIDLRYHYSVNSINSFAYRLFVGVGYPYGNLEVLPFEKRFFSGGANGVRAWPVRGLGPGTYSETTSTFYNQTADIKLELNAEYRFKLVGLLEGAIFADGGNIWNIREEGSVDGGMFYWNEFYKQIAIGIGAGLRLDFNYFLLRFDGGIKARDPSLPQKQRWVLGNKPFEWSDIALNIAIGYPF
ncbi:MAG: BamA/TamA family outer membrane protein [Marinilabiliaceae bacterium]|nr:BamA/TamA family outer membrane protein [Marinilabiliaceae bacterium]